MKKIRIIAVLAAVITAIAVYIYLDSLKKPVVVPRMQVVVAMTQIKQGQKITDDMVEEKMIPSEAAVPNSATSKSDVVGEISSAGVEPGEQILTTKFFKAGDSGTGLSYVVDKGMRAITVPVDKVTGVAGFIKPNDRVDVLLIVDTNGVITPTQMKSLLSGDSEPQSSQPAQTPASKMVLSILLLEDIKVLAANQTMKAQDASTDASAQPETVTLCVSPQQALQLNLALAQGTIRLALRPYGEPDSPDKSNDVVTNLIDTSSVNLIPITGLTGPATASPATTSILPSPSLSPSLAPSPSPSPASSAGSK